MVRSSENPDRSPGNGSGARFKDRGRSPLGNRGGRGHRSVHMAPRTDRVPHPAGSTGMGIPREIYGVERVCSKVIMNPCRVTGVSMYYHLLNASKELARENWQAETQDETGLQFRDSPVGWKQQNVLPVHKPYRTGEPVLCRDLRGRLG